MSYMGIEKIISHISQNIFHLHHVLWEWLIVLALGRQVWGMYSQGMVEADNLLFLASPQDGLYLTCLTILIVSHADLPTRLKLSKE